MFTSTITAQPDSPSPPVGGPEIKVEYAIDPLIIKDVSGGKSFKIVVGLPFNLRGLQSQLPHPLYKWEIGDGDRFVFKTFWLLSPNIDKLSETATIPTFASPVNNSDFGSEHGIVRLTDSDNHSTLSTDPAPNANKKVQVFFQKDELNYSNPAEPNWFYYSKQFVDKKKIAEQHFKTHEQLKLNYKSGKPIKCVHPISDRKCYYRQLAIEEGGYSTNKGIHTFIEVLSHDNHHITLWNYFWPNGYKPDNIGCINKTEGLNSDCDQDYYPKWFEISTEGKLYDFNHDVGQDKYDKKLIEFRDWRSGAIINEVDKCVDAQKNTNFKLYDQMDWPFDPI